MNQNAPAPPPPPTPWPQQQQGDWVDFFLSLFACLFFLVALGTAFSQIDNDYRDWGIENRFKHDNAVGATANAVEYIAKNSRGSVASWTIAGLLCCVIISMRSVRRELVISREIERGNP